MGVGGRGRFKKAKFPGSVKRRMTVKAEYSGAHSPPIGHVMEFK